MECLINIIPLFVKTNISFLTGSETFLSVVDTMINADQTYLKMAKDFILKDFPGPVLKEFGNMMATMLNTYQRYGLEDQSPLVDLWAQVLISLPSWNRSKTVLYLVNMLCIRAFFQHTSSRVVKRVFCDIFKVKTATSDIMKLKTAFLKWQIKNSDQELPRNINLKKEISSAQKDIRYRRALI